MTRQYVERAIKFGENDSLFGILSTGAHPRDREQPAVVILNTGTVHRVGHNRMYVSLARDLAASGYPTFRFDFAGIGDSRPSERGASLLEGNMADIRMACDLLERVANVRRFILVGLCSGADYAVMYSETDSRIFGLVLLDPYVAKNPRYLIDRVLSKLTNPLNLVNFRPGKSIVVRTILQSIGLFRHEKPDLGHISVPGGDALETLERIYTHDVAAGVHFLVFCTGLGSTPRHTYKDQFKDCFRNVDFKDQLDLRFLRYTDHLFSTASSRAAMCEATLDWINRISFPPPQMSSSRAIHSGRG